MSQLRKRRALDVLPGQLEKRMRLTNGRGRRPMPFHPVLFLLQYACGLPAAVAWLCMQYTITEFETDEYGHAFFVTFLLRPRATLSTYQQGIVGQQLAVGTKVDTTWEMTRRMLLDESPASPRLVRVVRQLEATVATWYTFRLWRAPLLLVETAAFSVHDHCVHFALNLLAPAFFAAKVGARDRSATAFAATIFRGSHSQIPVDAPMDLHEVAHAPTPRFFAGVHVGDVDEEAVF